MLYSDTFVVSIKPDPKFRDIDFTVKPVTVVPTSLRATPEKTLLTSHDSRFRLNAVGHLN